MRFYKVVQTRAKYMKVSYSSSRGEVWGHIKFIVTKKCYSGGEKLNALVSLAGVKALKMNNNPKDKSVDNSDSKDDSEHSN